MTERTTSPWGTHCKVGLTVAIRLSKVDLEVLDARVLELREKIGELGARAHLESGLRGWRQAVLREALRDWMTRPVVDRRTGETLLPAMEL